MAAVDLDSLSETAPVLSVVVPVYGCQPCLRRLHERLSATLSELGRSYEILLVDDRAEDGSWPEIERLARLDGAVRGIRLSRNFGQHAAITAGLNYAWGAWVVVMDCDLQDPPEAIPSLWAKAQEGHDIVFGRRLRKPTGVVRGLLGRLYFRGIRVFAESPVDGQYGSFSLVSRKVVDAFLTFKDEDRHYMMILTWLKFDTAWVDYEPAPRYEGRSSYSLPKLIEHALDGVFFQTTVLLRWIVYMGFGLALLGGLLALRVVYAKAVGTVFPGWTSLVAGGLFVGGFIILSTGITGLYIGKVFDQVRARPVFVVDEIVERNDWDGTAPRLSSPSLAGEGESVSLTPLSSTRSEPSSTRVGVL